MTHEQFITLETAKLAKQAGFNWDCAAYYKPAVFDSELKVSDYGLVENYNRPQYNAIVESFSVPTQAVLQRWLREVKNLIIEIHLSTKYIGQIITDTNGYYYVISNKEKYLTPFREHLTRFETYETALEAGLQECLKLLIENKAN